MNSFNFISPTRLIFGKNAEVNTGSLLKDKGNVLVLLSYGQTNASGIVDRTIDSLKKEGINYVELSGIKPNPLLSKVYEGLELVKKHDIKFILAVGGGSIIDTAKAIAAGAVYDGDVWHFYETDDYPTQALPLGVVLTIPAAGSELSTGTVITNEKTQQKFATNSDALRPVFAISDPEVTLTLPAWHTFAGVTDMFVHIIERYITPTQYTDFTDRISEGAMKSIIYNGLKLVDNPKDIHARADIMLAGTFAHNGVLALGRSEEWVAHNLGHAISALFDITHGATLAITTPAWMKYIMDANLDRLVQFANRVFDVEIDLYDKKLTALEGIYRLEQFFTRIGMPTRLTHLDIPTDTKTLDALADNYGVVAPIGSSKEIYRDDARKIYDIGLK